MDFLKLAFLSAYAICKIPFINLHDRYIKLVLLPILSIGAVLLLLLLLLIATPFVCFRGLVFSYLKLKHGKNFIKIFNFLSTLFLISEEQFATERFIFIVDCHDVYILERGLRNNINAVIENVSDVSGYIKRCSGYYCLFKRSITVDDIFSLISIGDEKILKEEDLSYHIENSNLNDSLLFQVKLIKNPLKGSKYAILCLFHHSMTDAHGALGIIYKYIFDTQTTVASPNTELLPRDSVRLNDAYVNPHFFKGILTDGLDGHHEGPHVALFSENKECCIPKLKFLRKMFNCTFTEVIMGVIIYNVFEYMKKHLRGCPKIITVLYVHHNDIEYRMNFRDSYFPDGNLTNNSFLLLFHLENLENYQDFGDFMNYIRLKSQEAYRSMEIQISYITSVGLLDFMPDFMYRKTAVHQLNQPSIAFSNVGLMKNVSISEQRVNASLGTMHCSSSGLHVGVSSYDNKLQLVLSSKLHFIKSRNNLQSVLNKTVSQIHELCKEA